jgi:tRNA nucleotidyltransferase (CCA-adding enzyme)
MAQLYIDIMRELCQSGYEALLVGGPVRDLLLGREPVDFDVATNATPDQVQAVLGDNYKICLAGANFKVTIVTRDREQVEVATYRTDESFGHGHKDFIVKAASSFEEDSERRDFTFNALGMCLTGDILDYHNGIEDLQKRVVRFVSTSRGVADCNKNGTQTIEDDPLRMVRAARFLAFINGAFDPSTFQAIRERAYLLDTVPRERIRMELFKAMATKHASRFFFALQETGLLERFLPSLSKCYGHAHGRHHFEDVFEHCMLVGDSISTKYPVVKLAGYLHDVGKPISAARNEKGELMFIGHEKTGADILRQELAELRFSLEEVDTITKLTRYHMSSITKESTPHTIRRLIHKFTENGVNYKEFLRLKVADRAGNLRRNKFTISEIKKLQLLFENILFSSEPAAFSVKDLAINGNDVMKLLNVKPGPIVGTTLNALLQLVLEDPSLNTVETLSQLVSQGL